MLAECVSFAENDHHNQSTSHRRIFDQAPHLQGGGDERDSNEISGQRTNVFGELLYDWIRFYDYFSPDELLNGNLRVLVISEFCKFVDDPPGLCVVSE